MGKIADLPIDDQVYNWLVDFLSGRQHITKHKGTCSASLSINASIVHGSGIGPVMYIINASDLHPIHLSNITLKYADDTYLIVPSVNSHLIKDELKHVCDWANSTNLKLNVSKSVEVIISLPHKKGKFSCPISLSHEVSTADSPHSLARSRSQ